MGILLVEHIIIYIFYTCTMPSRCNVILHCDKIATWFHADWSVEISAINAKYTAIGTFLSHFRNSNHQIMSYKFKILLKLNSSLPMKLFNKKNGKFQIINGMQSYECICKPTAFLSVSRKFLASYHCDLSGTSFLLLECWGNPTYSGRGRLIQQQLSEADTS